MATDVPLHRDEAGNYHKRCGSRACDAIPSCVCSCRICLRCPNTNVGGRYPTTQCILEPGHAGSHIGQPFGEGGVLSWPNKAPWPE